MRRRYARLSCSEDTCMLSLVRNIDPIYIRWENMQMNKRGALLGPLLELFDSAV